MLPYTYVPGRCPHPLSHVDGHRFLGQQPAEAKLDPDQWRSCDAYTTAIKLFNAGFYWEAHEVWESCWNAAGRTGWLADFLKALIKLAAALVKAREGRAAGVERHANRALQLLTKTQRLTKSPANGETDAIGDAEQVAGLSLHELHQLAKRLAAQAESLAEQHRGDDPYDVQPIAEARLVASDA